MRFKTIEEAQQAVVTRLRAEEAACKMDPTLDENEFVQGCIWTLKWFLGEVKG